MKTDQHGRQAQAAHVAGVETMKAIVQDEYGEADEVSARNAAPTRSAIGSRGCSDRCTSTTG